MRGPVLEGLRDRAREEGVSIHELAERVLGDWLEGGDLVESLEAIVRRMKSPDGGGESAA